MFDVIGCIYYKWLAHIDRVVSVQVLPIVEEGSGACTEHTSAEHTCALIITMRMRGSAWTIEMAVASSFTLPNVVGPWDGGVESYCASVTTVFVCC